MTIALLLRLGDFPPPPPPALKRTSYVKRENDFHRKTPKPTVKKDQKMQDLFYPNMLGYASPSNCYLRDPLST